MANFHYQAIDDTGQLVAGELEADNVQQAIAQLENRGLAVQSIGNASSTPIHAQELLDSTDHAADRVSAKPRQSTGESVEQAVLRTHMATILERGRAIAPALAAYAEEMPAGRQRRQLLAVCRVLATGDATEATAALAELPEFWIPLLSAATSSTDPGHVLREFLSESRQTDELRQQWWLSLAYPILLACLAAVVMVALSIFVIPEFRAIFIEFDLELPAITSFVLTMAQWLSSWGLLVIAAFGVAFLVLLLNANRLLPSSTFAWLGDRFRPPFGRRTAVARFARFTADLLEAGVSMPDALRIAGFTVNRSRLQRAAWGLASDIESTGGCSVRAYHRPLTATVLHALTAETSPATRVRLLREISVCHAERVRIGLSWTSGIVEPFAICLVGFWVGLVVLALFIPLVKLVEGLSG